MNKFWSRKIGIKITTTKIQKEKVIIKKGIIKKERKESYQISLKSPNFHFWLMKNSLANAFAVVRLS